MLFKESLKIISLKNVKFLDIKSANYD